MCCIFQFECSINCHPLSGGSGLVISPKCFTILRGKSPWKDFLCKLGVTVHGSRHSVCADMMDDCPWARLHSAVCKTRSDIFICEPFRLCWFVSEWFIKTPNICSCFQPPCQQGMSLCLEEFYFQWTAFQWLSVENLSVSWCSESHFRAAKIEERIVSLLTFKKLHQCQTLQSCISA